MDASKSPDQQFQFGKKGLGGRPLALLAVAAIACCTLTACDMPDENDDIDEPPLPTVPEPQVQPTGDWSAPLPPPKTALLDRQRGIPDRQLDDHRA